MILSLYEVVNGQRRTSYTADRMTTTQGHNILHSRVNCCSSINPNTRQELMMRRGVQRRRGPILRETSIPDPKGGSASRTGDAIEHVIQLGVFESKFFQEVMDRRSRETTKTNFPGEVKNFPIIFFGEEVSFETHVSFHFGHGGLMQSSRKEM